MSGVSELRHSGRDMRGGDALVARLVTLAAAHASGDQPSATFRALDEALDALIGRKLLTVLVVRHETGLVERAFTNLPQDYPSGGTKRIADAPRLRQVVASGEAFIARTRAEVAANYADAEAIFATGCASILNMPVIWRQRVVATVNLLHAEGFYEARHIPLVRCLAQAVLPAILDPLTRSDPL
ncbi:MAG: GAF domain-containing protein [Janthinobacterium lividum]